MHIVSNATGPPATTENKALIWGGELVANLSLAHILVIDASFYLLQCAILFSWIPLCRFVSICVETLIPSTCFVLDALSCPVRFLTRPVTVICHLYWPKPLSKITRTTMYMFFRQRLQLRYTKLNPSPDQHLLRRQIPSVKAPRWFAGGPLLTYMKTY